MKMSLLVGTSHGVVLNSQKKCAFLLYTPAYILLIVWLVLICLHPNMPGYHLTTRAPMLRIAVKHLVTVPTLSLIGPLRRTTPKFTHAGLPPPPPPSSLVSMGVERGDRETMTLCSDTNIGDTVWPAHARVAVDRIDSLLGHMWQSRTDCYY